MEVTIYPENFEEKIGFEQVREMLADLCLSATGRDVIQHISFSTSRDLIKQEMRRIAEFMNILNEGLSFPAQDYLDLIPTLHRIQTPGSSLLTDELQDLRVSLSTISGALEFLHRSDPDQFFALKELSSEIKIPKSIPPGIDKILDEKAQIRNNASSELAGIRKEIKAKAAASDKVMRSLLSLARKNGWVAKETEPTLRDGRLVLPVLAPHKRRIRGLIHDESATGHTIYMEPDECFELNNEVRNLELAEKREIKRILTEFTDTLRPDIPELIAAHHFIGVIDSIRARARFGLRIGSQVPELVDHPYIQWNNALHPLLFLSHKAKGKEVVPQNVQLDGSQRILVISGPNAGGKSVCLKTIGLLQYMVQCGLPVPMDNGSKAGIFQQVFLEIGDEQSLENDLSTYSSHLLHIRHFIENCSTSTLFLIDEFGSGTDPSLGGAIAEAALERLNEKKAYGVITTHYSNLKILAGNAEGIVNGAMMFDTHAMKPLYRLEIGNPGSSFTYEIASKIGFPREVIKNALEKTGKTHLDFEKQLQALDTEKRELDRKKEEFTVADDFLDELIGRYEKMKEELDTSRKQILDEAREKASQLLEESNRLIERTIKEIKESAAEKERTKKVRRELEKKKVEIKQSESAKADKRQVKPGPEFREGDWVKIAGQDKVGKILLLKGKEATVDFNGIRFTVKTVQLELTDSPIKTSGPGRSPTSGYASELQEKTAHFKLTLDVRGKTAEEALQLVRKYLDDAYLLRIREVNILHGKGDGILRKVIREMLAKSDEIESYSDEHIERGGSGITKVVLK
jgi:DNA mismatch repair protein MutS2